jgi:tetratricopeptide (TPR) repeat protein
MRGWKSKKGPSVPWRRKKTAPGEGHRPALAEAMVGSPLARMEKTNRAITRLLSAREFKNIDEMNAFLQQALASGQLDRLTAELPADPQEQAQDLAYQAMDASSEREARRLAERALKLDPDCVDARLVLMECETLTIEEHLERLKATVAAGQRSLGADFFRENRGHFWGVLESRPYMRARFQLGVLLLMLGRHEEAIREFEEMLELNPNDNQGVRDELLGLYLLTDRLDGADRLFRQYRDDCSATFAWARVLRDWIAGNIGAATRALDAALKRNRHVADLLAGRKKLPLPPSDYYALGSREEAVHCVLAQGEAWLSHPAAPEWLRAALQRRAH